MKSMGWTTKDTLKTINNEIQYVQPPLMQNGSNKSQKARQCWCCDKCTCECVKKVERKIPIKSQENEDPFQASSKKSPHYALPQQCNRQERFEPSQQALDQSLRNSKLSKPNLINGGVELVPLLAKRRDERPISLSTTDITKYQINKSR